MTIWMDTWTVREELIEPFDVSATITTDEPTGDRHKMEITYQESLTIDQFDFNRIERFLSAIGDGNPEIELTAQNNQLVLTLTADEDVYREEN